MSAGQGLVAWGVVLAVALNAAVVSAVAAVRLGVMPPLELTEAQRWRGMLVTEAERLAPRRAVQAAPPRSLEHVLRFGTKAQGPAATFDGPIRLLPLDSPRIGHRSLRKAEWRETWAWEPSYLVELGTEADAVVFVGARLDGARPAPPVTGPMCLILDGSEHIPQGQAVVVLEDGDGYCAWWWSREQPDGSMLLMDAMESFKDVRVDGWPAYVSHTLIGTGAIWSPSRQDSWIVSWEDASRRHRFSVAFRGLATQQIGPATISPTNRPYAEALAALAATTVEVHGSGG